MLREYRNSVFFAMRLLFSEFVKLPHPAMRKIYKFISIINVYYIIDVTTKLFFVGDCVFSGKIPLNFFSEELLALFKKHDICNCNIEAPVENTNAKPIVKVGPVLCQPKEVIERLKSAGFNFFTIANNHIMDYGTGGLQETIATFGNTPYIGAGLNSEDIYKPYITEAKGTKIGFLAVAEGGFGAAFEDRIGYSYMLNKRVKLIIKQMCSECDFCILICHAGAEHWSVPLPEIRDLYKEFIDAGIHCIIGHHPHVPQGCEEYNNGIIFYSLGNFFFDKGKGIQNPESICISLSLEKGKKIEYNIIPTIFRNGMVELNKEFDKEMDRLNGLLIKNYMETVDDYLIKSTSRYIKCYKNICYNYNSKPKQWLKGLVKKYILRQGFQPKWIFHNIAIETHLWICRRIFIKDV